MKHVKTGLPCTVDKCPSLGKRRGLCVAHYHRFRKFGDPTIENPPPRKRPKGTLSFKSGLPCSIDDCDKLRFSRGWCAMHYYRWKMHGTTDASEHVFIPKGQGKGRNINGVYFTPNRLAYHESRGTIPRCACNKGEAMHVRFKNGEMVLHSEADQARDVFTKWHGCKVKGCDSTHLRGGSHGYCKRHYTQMNTHGKIISVDKVPREERTQFHRPPHLRGKNVIPSTFRPSRP